jgi:hypothetical protein
MCGYHCQIPIFLAHNLKLSFQSLLRSNIWYYLNPIFDQIQLSELHQEHQDIENLIQLPVVYYWRLTSSPKQADDACMWMQIITLSSGFCDQLQLVEPVNVNCIGIPTCCDASPSFVHQWSFPQEFCGSFITQVV